MKSRLNWGMAYFFVFSIDWVSFTVYQAVVSVHKPHKCVKMQEFSWSLYNNLKNFECF